MARFITATMAVVITLAFGTIVFGLPLGLGQMNLALFFASLVLGILSLAFLSLFLGALTLVMTRESWEIGEGGAGAPYIFSGAVFPLSILPDWLRLTGLGLPTVYWLELIRRSLVGTAASAFPTVVCFDPFQPWRMGGIDALTRYYESVWGMAHIDRDEIINPRVQLIGDADAARKTVAHKDLLFGKMPLARLEPGVSPSNVRKRIRLPRRWFSSPSERSWAWASAFSGKRLSARASVRTDWSTGMLYHSVLPLAVPVATTSCPCRA